jgi:hypothetical protein
MLLQRFVHHRKTVVQQQELFRCGIFCICSLPVVQRLLGTHHKHSVHNWALYVHHCPVPTRPFSFLLFSYFITLIVPVLQCYCCQKVLRLFSYFDHFTNGRTPWTSDQLVARPLPKHRRTQTQNKHVRIWNIYALCGIRTHDPGFRASEDSTCLRPLGYRDRRQPKRCLLSLWFRIFGVNF